MILYEDKIVGDLFTADDANSIKNSVNHIYELEGLVFGSSGDLSIATAQQIRDAANLAGYQVPWSQIEPGFLPLNRLPAHSHTNSDLPSNVARTDVSNVFAASNVFANNGFFLGPNAVTPAIKRGLLHLFSTTPSLLDGALVIENTSPTSGPWFRMINDIGTVTQMTHNSSSAGNSFLSSINDGGRLQSLGIGGLAVMSSSSNINAHLRFGTGGSGFANERMRITSSGRILAGPVSSMTDDGSSILQVGGAISASQLTAGNVTASGLTITRLQGGSDLRIVPEASIDPVFGIMLGATRVGGVRSNGILHFDQGLFNGILDIGNVSNPNRITRNNSFNIDFSDGFNQFVFQSGHTAEASGRSAFVFNTQSSLATSNIFAIREANVDRFAMDHAGNITASGNIYTANTADIGWSDAQFGRIGAGTVGVYQANGTTLGDMTANQFLTSSARYEGGRVWHPSNFQIHAAGNDGGLTSFGNQQINLNRWTGSEYTLDLLASSKRVHVRTDLGMRVLNSAGNADAPITASAGTFSGNVTLNNNQLRLRSESDANWRVNFGTELRSAGSLELWGNTILANSFLGFGGSSSSHPLITRLGATSTLRFRTGDDLADAPITASAGTFSGSIRSTTSRFIGSDPLCFIDIYNPSTGQLVLEGNSGQAAPFGDVVVRTGGADRVRFGAPGSTAMQVSGAITASGSLGVGALVGGASSFGVDANGLVTHRHATQTSRSFIVGGLLRAEEYVNTTTYGIYNHVTPASPFTINLGTNAMTFGGPTTTTGIATFSGNVGIGGPASVRLRVDFSDAATVLGAVGDYVQIRNANATAGNIAAIGLFSQNAAAGAAIATQNNDLVFATGMAWTERMRISNATGSTTFSGNVTVGSLASVSTSSPRTLSLGGTYTPTAGDPSKCKLKIYDDGTAVYGLGASNSELEYHIPSGGFHSFYTGAVKRTEVSNSGLAVTGAITASGNVAFGANLSVYSEIKTGTISNWGYITSKTGTSTTTGYLEWFKPSGARTAYMGYDSGNNLTLALESSSPVFNVVGGGVTASGNIYTANTADIGWSDAQFGRIGAGSIGVYGADGVTLGGLTASNITATTANLSGALTAGAATFSDTLIAGRSNASIRVRHTDGQDNNKDLGIWKLATDTFAIADFATGTSGFTLNTVTGAAAFNGNVTVGNGSPSRQSLTINGWGDPALWFTPQANTNLRWMAVGSSSVFEIQRYNASAYVSSPISISHTTDNVTFSGNVNTNYVGRVATTEPSVRFASGQGELWGAASLVSRWNNNGFFPGANATQSLGQLGSAWGMLEIERSSSSDAALLRIRNRTSGPTSNLAISVIEQGLASRFSVTHAGDVTASGNVLIGSGQTDAGTGASLSAATGIYTPGFVWATGGLNLTSANSITNATAGPLIVARFTSGAIQLVNGGPVLQNVGSTGFNFLQSNGTTPASIATGAITASGPVNIATNGASGLEFYNVPGGTKWSVVQAGGPGSVSILNGSGQWGALGAAAITSTVSQGTIALRNNGWGPGIRITEPTSGARLDLDAFNWGVAGISANNGINFSTGGSISFATNGVSNNITLAQSGAEWSLLHINFGSGLTGFSTALALQADNHRAVRVTQTALEQCFVSNMPSYRSRMLAAGQRASEVGDGAGAWQTTIMETYNASNPLITLTGNVDLQRSNLGTNHWWRFIVEDGVAGSNGLTIGSMNTSVGYTFRRDGVFQVHNGDVMLTNGQRVRWGGQFDNNSPSIEGSYATGAVTVRTNGGSLVVNNLGNVTVSGDIAQGTSGNHHMGYGRALSWSTAGTSYNNNCGIIGTSDNGMSVAAPGGFTVSGNVIFNNHIIGYGNLSVTSGGSQFSVSGSVAVLSGIYPVLNMTGNGVNTLIGSYNGNQYQRADWFTWQSRDSTANWLELDSTGLRINGRIEQGFNTVYNPSYRSVMTAAGIRNSQIGSGSGSWDTVFSEEYDILGSKISFFGNPRVTKRSGSVTAGLVELGLFSNAKLFLDITEQIMESGFMYYGGLEGTSWKINRFNLTTFIKQSATQANNSGTTTLTTAWTNRATLTYA